MKTRDEKLELARNKKKFWTEWGGGKNHPEPEPKPKPRTEEIDPSAHSKKSAGGGREERGETGIGLNNAEPTPPKNTSISPIVGAMQVGQAEVRYSHCAERQ